MASRTSRPRRTRSGLQGRRAAPPAARAGRSGAPALAGSGRRRRASAQRRPRRRLRGLLIALAVAASVGVGGIATVFVAYASYRAQLPDAATVAAMEPATDTHVYDSKGELIGILNSTDFRHVHASLDSISPYVKNATIDIEDRHFYSEGSWDLPRLVKAGWTDLTHSGSLQGASTITEQVAKLSFFSSSPRSIDYKIKEIVLGNELDANFTKAQILDMYLNRVPYGNHAVGIESAANLYFLIPAKNLDLAQASMLAGLPQSPSAYQPNVHDASVDVNPRAKERQKQVLDAMVSNGDITQAQASAAYAEKLTFHSWTESNPNPYPDVMDYVTRYLTFHFGDAYTHPGGWAVYTTIDPTAQNNAQTALTKGIQAIRTSHNGKDGAVVTIDPKTGKILAIVGAWDHNDPDTGQTDMALAGRSPGSTIKIYTYSAAIASHLFTMESPILDAPVHLRAGDGSIYSPLNYDRRYHGVCPLRVCLGNSFNIPAVKVEAAVGIPLITNLEIAGGLTALADPANRPGPQSYSATLGGELLSPLEMADGAATIADLGVHHDPSPVDHIVDTLHGRTVFRLDPNSTARQVIPASVAFIMSEITSNDSNRVAEFGPHSDLTLPDRRVSAKTGTAEFFLDNWTIGWTPDIVTAVWVGNPYDSCLKGSDRATMAAAIARGNVLYSGQTVNDPFSPQDLARYGLQPLNNACGHLDNSSGITGAAPIWNAVMRADTTGTKPDWYPVPKDVIQVGTGDNADFFLPGTQYQSAPCYYYGAPGSGPPAAESGCVYGGTQGPPPPPPSPTPSAAPTPGPTSAPAPAPTPATTPSPSPGIVPTGG
ncbi:MAG: transglycosylase domain-containing protein [Candidatus Dormibacteria bacterium]